ncbi:hypothetical protein HDU98_007745 [Podochytrium sp. JEL0797]|nr:hypothetical protein HDU98_007745 [Podochytrium sp. JEL0797]
MDRATLHKIMEHMPKEFAFYPPIDKVPLKPRAVITSLLSPYPRNPHPLRSEIDSTFLQTLLQAHLHTTHPSPTHEFIVLIHLHTPPRYKTALLHLGARLLLVPAIELSWKNEHGNQELLNRYTILQLWKLEGILNAVLYIDSRVFFTDSAHQSLNPREGVQRCWAIVDAWEAEKPGKNLFAGVTEWRKVNGTGVNALGPVDTGVMLFKPNGHHFDALMERAGRVGKEEEKGEGDDKKMVVVEEPYSKSFEEGVIGKYFMVEEADAGWFVELEKEMNVGDLSWLNTEQNHILEQGGSVLGISMPFWEQKDQPVGSEFAFGLWAGAMQGLRRRQLELYKLHELDAPFDLHAHTDGGDCVIPVVPVVVRDLDLWNQTRRSGMMYDSIALLSSDGASEEFLKMRDSLAGMYQQADHFVFPKSQDLGNPRTPQEIGFFGLNNSSLVSYSLLDVLAKAGKILSEYQYDWVWFIPDTSRVPADPAIAIIPLHISLGSIYDLTERSDVIFFENDCTGGFLMHRRVNEKLLQFVWDANERAKYSSNYTFNAQVQKDFMEEFERYVDIVNANKVATFPVGDCVGDYL